MDLFLMRSSYNSYGADSTLAVVPPLLLREGRNFGQAIETIEITFHLPSDGPARPTLEHLLQNYQQKRAALARNPKVTFMRKKARVAILVATDICFPDFGPPRLDLLEPAAEETIRALEFLRKRVLISDAFDLDGFLTSCRGYREMLPKNNASLKELSEVETARLRTAYESLSAWEKLDIDFADYHPDARKILDDPFFWDKIDEYAPNGNDTGADLLHDFMRWHRKNHNGDAAAFFRAFVTGWGFSSVDDPLFQSSHDDAAVALAFAEIKVRGRCSESVKTLAITALYRQRTRSTLPHELSALAKIEEKLRFLD